MKEYKGLKYQWNKYKESFNVYLDGDLIATMRWKNQPKLWINQDPGYSLSSSMFKKLGDLADYLDEEATKIASVAKVINKLGIDK